MYASGHVTLCSDLLKSRLSFRSVCHHPTPLFDAHGVSDSGKCRQLWQALCLPQQLTNAIFPSHLTAELNLLSSMWSPALKLSIVLLCSWMTPSFSLPSGVQKATPGSAQDRDRYQHRRNQVGLSVCALMFVQLFFSLCVLCFSVSCTVWWISVKFQITICRFCVIMNN